MRWLLFDIGMVLAVVVLVGLSAFRVWRKVVSVKSAAGELRGRLETLNTETTALAARLDTAEVTARLTQRSR